MKKLSWFQKVAAILKAAKIPANVIAVILTLGKNNLTEIVFSANMSALTALPGIAEKRATIILATLKKAMSNARLSSKAERREKAPGYSCRTYAKEELWREIIDVTEAIKGYRPEKDEDPAIRTMWMKRKKALCRKLFGLQLKPVTRARKPHIGTKHKPHKYVLVCTKPLKLTVRQKMGRIIRLSKSAISEVLNIDYEDKTPTNRMMVVEHGIQDVFNFSPYLFNNDYTQGLSMLDDFQKKIERMLVNKGVRVINKDNTTKLYGGVASSSSHQKQEKLLMVGAEELKANEDFFWFTNKPVTKEEQKKVSALFEFSTHTQMQGAERLKATANLIRPWMKPFVDSNGNVIKMSDILFVEDVEKIYVIKNARRIGKIDGRLYHDGEDKEAKVLWDGAIGLFDSPDQGQASSTGLKGFAFSLKSTITAFCEKHGMTIKQFFNLEVKSIDGKMHRLGDFKGIAGAGCWKLDKAFSSFDSYMVWLKKQADKHNGLDNIYLLRQSEEIEDEEKVRRLTKSLIQQWLVISPTEIRKLTKNARNDLKRAKSFTGSVKKLAALWKNPDERTAVERLFYNAPWLVMNPVIQDYLKDSWNKKLIEAASCKFRTEGQYPYIMQDPVAMLECWVLSMDPNSPDLGILRGDEVSVADVPEDKELLCVRFPANFMTAMVMKNKACRKEFGSMNGVMVLSIYSDILIRQDGDVDGDEMCVIYNKLAIELTKRMISEIKPPVILFQHGSKAKRHGWSNPEEFLNDVADALWRAKRYDSVGLYANLAMKCAYLAGIAQTRGDMKKRDLALLWMSAASTGAILAIDQVKGNAVDESLINWLEEIQKSVRKEFKNVAAEMGFGKAEQYKKVNPFSHFYNEAAKRRPISVDYCLPAHEDNAVDQISSIILSDAGTFEEYDAQGVTWVAAAANEALFGNAPEITVKYGVVTQKMIDLLGDNWFKFAAKADEVDATLETRKKLKVGTQIGMKEFMLLLWRNEASMAYSMEGQALWEKKEEYYSVCRELIQMFLVSGNWVNQYAKSYPVGYEFSIEERRMITVNAVVRDALEITGKNGLDKNKGSYAMFCLKIFANDLLLNLKKNRVDKTRFFESELDMDDIVFGLELDKAEETIELFEKAPMRIETDEYEEISPMSDEELMDLIANCPEEDDGWIPPMEDGFIPEEC